MQQATPNTDPQLSNPANTNSVNTNSVNTNPAAGEETLPDMIAQLVPPPEPPPISLWPATPLAKGLCVLLLLLLLFFIWRQIQRYRANAYRRAALAELQQSENNPAQIAEIIRRTALVAYPRETVAALTGDAWLQFLNQHYPGNAFDDEVGRTLLQGPYRKGGSEHSGALARAARDWIRQHKVARPGTDRFQGLQNLPPREPEAAP